MKPLDLLELFTLGALWGGSFLFMRVAAPEFGPVVLIALRVSIAFLFLLPILLHQGCFPIMRRRIGGLAVVGTINSALPFTLFAFATLSLSAGFTAVLNATAPLFTAIVAFLWLGERPGRLPALGLMVGFGGVVLLVWDKIDVSGNSVALAIAAGLGASLCYGVAANHTRVHMSGLGSLELAGGSQLTASIILLPLCFFYWPEQAPSLTAWLSVLVLGVVCTGIAYILFFRLLTRLGPAKAVTVTFIVPLAAMVLGAVLLAELVTTSMLAGCGLILLGTALATGVVKPGLKGS
ncbi:MAG: DMT family transporter [Halieaceae bacterium]